MAFAASFAGRISSIIEESRVIRLAYLSVQSIWLGLL